MIGYDAQCAERKSVGSQNKLAGVPKVRAIHRVAVDAELI